MAFARTTLNNSKSERFCRDAQARPGFCFFACPVLNQNRSDSPDRGTRSREYPVQKKRERVAIHLSGNIGMPGYCYRVGIGVVVYQNNIDIHFNQVKRHTFKTRFCLFRPEMILRWQCLNMDLCKKTKNERTVCGNCRKFILWLISCRIHLHSVEKCAILRGWSREDDNVTFLSAF